MAKLIKINNIWLSYMEQKHITEQNLIVIKQQNNYIYKVIEKRVVFFPFWEGSF